MNARYALTTQWWIECPVEPVWDALTAPETWPRWWRYVDSVVPIQAGDADGIGAVRRYTWSSRLPYRLVFDMETTVLVKRSRIEGVAQGELCGTGRWDIAPDARGTRVRYVWRVATAKRWMNRLAPLLAPVFAWNHDQVMAEGGLGLARHLGVRCLGLAGTSQTR